MSCLLLDFDELYAYDNDDNSMKIEIIIMIMIIDYVTDGSDVEMYGPRTDFP